MTKLMVEPGPYELTDEGELRIKNHQIMRPWWVSWFEADCPWQMVNPYWIHGYRMDEEGEQQAIICAAIMAFNEEHAVEVIYDHHHCDGDYEIEFIFVEDRPLGWTPFHETGMPRQSWMQWDQAPH